MNIPKDISPGTTHQSNTCGQMVVIGYQGKKNVSVYFRQTGTITTARADCVRKGQVKDPYFPSVCGVGCLGEGPHRSMVSYRATKPYVHWLAMMHRCYLPAAQARKPSYVGCVVAPEWHNFQNFAQWFETTYPGGDYQLDKDTLVAGNRVYGPTTCVWLTPSDNSAAANRSRATAPASN